MNAKLFVRMFLLLSLLVLAGCATPEAPGLSIAPLVTQPAALAPVEATVTGAAPVATDPAVTGVVTVEAVADGPTATVAPTVDGLATQIAEGIAATQAAQAHIDDAVAATVAAQVAALPPTAAPSPTAVPTATAMPTATPPPTATACRLELTAGLNAFVRTGPGTNYPALGVLQNGESATIIGRPANTTTSDWWVIDFAGHDGWISASVVTLNGCPAEVPPIPPPPAPTPTATATPPPMATPLPTVIPPRVATINLLEMAPQALWMTGELLPDGHNMRRATAIPFGGEGSTGAARLKSQVLEDGTRRTVLDTHPMWIDNGTIKGWFPWALLPPNTAEFQTEIGFISGAGHTDGVTFWVWEHHYENGREVWNPVARVTKEYDGRLLPLRIDLSHLAGQAVSIELRVDAGASSGQDWAVWVAPRIIGN